MRTPEGDEILEIIRRHVGRENAIDAYGIAYELGWPQGSSRNVRRIIANEFCLWPLIVCARAGTSDGGGGYFVAETYEEIEAYWAYLDDLRAAAELKVRNFENLCSKNGIKLQHQQKAA